MKKDMDHIGLRKAAGFHLLANPNYFGNLTGIDLGIGQLPAPVLSIKEDRNFEELTCVGYNPATHILTAIVQVKQGSGYSGGPCTDGSQEYVRFYLDYGDGVWADHGVNSFAAHDLSFKGHLCYAVSIQLQPHKMACCDDRPVLPTVRAILSWNTMPPAAQPNWLPVWGNRLERAIQIAPRSVWWCKFFDHIDVAGIKKIDPALVAKLTQLIEVQPPIPGPGPVESMAHLMSATKTKGDMAALRHVFPAVMKLANDPTDIAANSAVMQLKMLDFDISKWTDFLIAPKFDTTFEELHCVGLDRDKNLLHGVVQVKLPNGYSGGLCTQGSREYIAFYLDFGAGWEYQGTTFVDVHDVGVPKGGLWYQAALPVNLDEHRKAFCETGQARIRGILSWQVAPPANDPEFIPHWGDREDCAIEIKPLPKGVTPGQLKPYLEAIGRMPISKINAAGFANNITPPNFMANNSPFGGGITISGQIAFPGALALEYRVMVKGPLDPIAKPWTGSFAVTVTSIPGGPVDQTQVANGDWFPYLPQISGGVWKSVNEDLLGYFSATHEGLHEVYVDVRDAVSQVVLASSATQAFFVDNTAPTAKLVITSGGGNCSKFKVGEVLVGTFEGLDLHAGGLSLSVTPAGAATGGHMAITSVVPAAALPPPLPGPSASNSISYGALTLTTNGATGLWELDTTGMSPCGYNIRLDVADRTLVGSGPNPWTNADIVGFCLEK